MRQAQRRDAAVPVHRCGRPGPRPDPIGDRGQAADLLRVLVRDADRIALCRPVPRPHPGDGARWRGRPGARPGAAALRSGQGVRGRPDALPRRLRRQGLVRVPRERQDRQGVRFADDLHRGQAASHGPRQGPPPDRSVHRLVHGPRRALREVVVADAGGGAGAGQTRRRVAHAAHRRPVPGPQPRRLVFEPAGRLHGQHLPGLPGADRRRDLHGPGRRSSSRRRQISPG